MSIIVLALAYMAVVIRVRCNSVIDTLSISRPFFFIFNTESPKINAPIAVRFLDLKGELLDSVLNRRSNREDYRLTSES